jgi:hypothetical protein
MGITFEKRVLFTMGIIFCLALTLGCDGPCITNIDPPAAYVGDQVSIEAIGFYLGYSQPESTTITFNDVDAGRADWWMCYGGALCDIRIDIPAGAASGCVVLTDEELGPSNCYPFMVLE